MFLDDTDVVGSLFPCIVDSLIYGHDTSCQGTVWMDMRQSLLAAHVATMRRVTVHHMMLGHSRTGLAVPFVSHTIVFPPLGTCPCMLWCGLAYVPGVLAPLALVFGSYVGTSRVTVLATI